MINPTPYIRPEDRSSAYWKRLLLGTLRPWLALGLVCALFSLHADFRRTFWTMSSLPDVLQQSGRNIVLAVGMSFVILTGGIDLSIGAVLALCGVGLAMALGGKPAMPLWLAFVAALPLAAGCAWLTYRMLRVRQHDIRHTTVRITAVSAMSVLVIVEAMGGFGLAQAVAHGLKVEGAILVGLLIGMACGLVNGLVVSLGRVPSFVMTLGMMTAARGLTLSATDGSSVSAGYPRLMALGQGMPLVLITLLVVALGTILLIRTRLGRYITAIGGNEQASRLTGVDVAVYKTLAYLLAGLAAGIGALLVTAKFGLASTNAGSGAELDAIAAVVIGGTSLSGGRGSIVGALVGALTITVIKIGLVLVHVADNVQPVILGVVIVLTVFLDNVRGRR